MCVYLVCVLCVCIWYAQSSILLADSSVPTKSDQEPLVSHSKEQRASDVEHLLASISHFDHTHHGQMGTQCDDTIGTHHMIHHTPYLHTSPPPLTHDPPHTSPLPLTYDPPYTSPPHLTHDHTPTLISHTSHNIPHPHVPSACNTQWILLTLSCLAISIPSGVCPGARAFQVRRVALMRKRATPEGLFSAPLSYPEDSIFS